MIGGSDWIASILMGVEGSATQLFGDRIDVVFGAIADIGQNGAAQSCGSGGPAVAAGGGGMFTP